MDKLVICSTMELKPKTMVCKQFSFTAEYVAGERNAKNNLYFNGLLHKLEVDTTSYREATLLPGCVQQSLAAYVTEVRRFKKIVPQKIFLRFYRTGSDWEHDGVSYFPSYEELHAKPIRSVKREWQEAWMDYCYFLGPVL